MVWEEVSSSLGVRGLDPDGSTSQRVSFGKSSNLARVSNIVFTKGPRTFHFPTPALGLKYRYS